LTINMAVFVQKRPILTRNFHEISRPPGGYAVGIFLCPAAGAKSN